jgi:hypothetical protein
MRKKKQKKQGKSPGCRLVICKDPNTGHIIVKPDGECPPGYIKEIKELAERQGIVFPPEAYMK